MNWGPGPMGFGGGTLPPGSAPSKFCPGANPGGIWKLGLLTGGATGGGAMPGASGAPYCPPGAKAAGLIGVPTGIFGGGPAAGILIGPGCGPTCMGGGGWFC